MILRSQDEPESGITPVEAGLAVRWATRGVEDECNDVLVTVDESTLNEQAGESSKWEAHVSSPFCLKPLLQR